jgi:hypothetical protein
MRARFAATLPLILAACGDNTAPVGARSGDRLALYAFTFSDGTRQPDVGTYRDLVRGEDCVLEAWSDGAMYCTPFATDPVYADATCSDAVARIAPSLVIPINYARVRFITGIGTTLTSRLRTLGVARSIAQYWKIANGGCTGPFDTSDGATFRTIETTELASDAFVHVRALVDDGDARLEPLRQRSDDGLSLAIGFHDRELALDCAVEPAAGRDTSRCAPTGAAPGSYFSDATCTTPSIPAAAASTATAIVSNAACPTYYALGTGLATTLYDGTPEHCVATTPGGIYLVAGAPLALANVTRTRASATTRYSPITFDTSDVRDRYVHDNLLDVDCSPVAKRCVPANDGTIIATLYADAACSSTLQLVYVPTTACGTLATYADDGSQLFPIGPLVTAPVYEISTSEMCAPALARDDLELHSLGAAVPYDALGAVTRDLL